MKYTPPSTRKYWGVAWFPSYDGASGRTYSPYWRSVATPVSFMPEGWSGTSCIRSMPGICIPSVTRVLLPATFWIGTFTSA